jgi:hypothetical protein
MTTMTDNEVETNLLTRLCSPTCREDVWNRNFFTPEERQEIIAYYERQIQWDLVPQANADEIRRRFREFA